MAAARPRPIVVSGSVCILLVRTAVMRVSEDAAGLVVEGRIAGPWVDELRRAARERAVRANAGSALAATSVDLAAVTYVDAEGVALLKELVAAGVRVRAASPFVAELLGRGG